MKENEKALLTVPELCSYLGICDTKARQLLKHPRCTFRVKLPGCNKLYAHRGKLDEWLEQQAKSKV